MRALQILVSSIILGSVGCASNQPPNPNTAANPPPNVLAAARATTAPRAPSQASTFTQVHIDDEILAACGIASDQAFFAFDSANLLDKDMQPLNAVAECFVNGALAGKSLKLIGRADPRGESEYNMVLGQSRADQVRGYLAHQGLAATRVDTTSRGELDAKGTDEATWAYDRRVDVVLGS